MAKDSVPETDAVVARKRAKYKRDYYRNREAAIARSKKWQAANQEHLKAYRAANREKIAQTSKEWAQNNPERAAAKTSRWRLANPDKIDAYRSMNKEKIEQRSKEWKRANPDMVRANVRKWHAAHPDAVKNWRKANPEAARAQVQTRRARVANAEGRHTADDLRLLLRQQNWRCCYCQKSIRTKYSVDHIQPLSRGGTNWITNIQLLCQSCNSAKQDADPIIFARRTGRLL